MGVEIHLAADDMFEVNGDRDALIQVFRTD